MFVGVLGLDSGLMRLTSRTAVLVAAVCLPLGVALGSYLLAVDPAAPRVPGIVRIGEASPAGAPTTTTTTTPVPPPAATQVVPPAPPVSDDDDDDDGDDDD